MTSKEQSNLPFATISISKQQSTAAARGWRFEIQLANDRIMTFFGLAIFPSENDYHDKALQEIISRINDTITYQKQLLDGNRVSVTNEDFFEQCLQKINSEINLLLRDIPVSLPIHNWGIMLSMITPDNNPNRIQFFTSRFGEIMGWLLHASQLDTKKLISIYDEPDPVPDKNTPHKFFRNIINSSLSINDQLFFCSPNLLSYVSLSELKKVLDTLSVQAAMKHFQNQITFNSTDSIIAALSIRLSVYPISFNTTTTPQAVNAESSMSNFLQTQSDTEKLLATSLGVNFKRVTGFLKSLSHSLKRKATPSNSEIVPSTNNRIDPGLFVKTIQVVVKTAGTGWVYIQKTTRIILKTVPQTKTGAKSNKRIRFMSTNETITKVSTLRKRIKMYLAPLLGRIKFLAPFVGQKSFKDIILSPIVLGTITVLILAIVGLSQLKKTHTQKVETIAAAQEAVEMVTNNINQIDSHLIVGRDGDALTLYKKSIELLNSAEGIESLNEKRSLLLKELNRRQQRLRKEVVITNGKEIVGGLNSLLQNPPKLLAYSPAALYVIAENPRNTLKITLTDNSNKLVEITTDVNQVNSATNIDNQQMLWLNNKSVTTLNLTNKTTVTAVINIQSEIIGAQIFNNRLYTLSESTNQILRSNRAPSYSVLSPWIKDSGVDLTNARDLAIDGAIYVLQPNAVQKFLSGSRAKPGINLDMIDPKLENAQQIWTDGTVKNIYILEPNRLLVYKKTGKFVAQYTIPEKTFKDMAIAGGGNIAYLLTDDEVLKISL